MEKIYTDTLTIIVVDGVKVLQVKDSEGEVFHIAMQKQPALVEEVELPTTNI